jgi:hypothetical protein
MPQHLADPRRRDAHHAGAIASRNAGPSRNAAPSRKTAPSPALSARRTARRLVALCLALAALPAAQAATPGDPAALCEAATARAAAASGVPAAVLRAIALTETGRGTADRRRPWPWAVNIAGTGRWHATRAAAHEAAAAALAAGTDQVDIGCFQINYRWHGAAFASLDAMLDPDANARHAAAFLAALHAETGDWTAAIGAYHSRTPARAAAYAARVAAHLPGAGAAPPAATPEPARRATAAADGAHRTTAYPLFHRATAASGPSLFVARAPAAAGPRGLVPAAAGPLFSRN